jgi:hypothetical protein
MHFLLYAFVALCLSVIWDQVGAELASAELAGAELVGAKLAGGVFGLDQGRVGCLACGC